MRYIVSVEETHPNSGRSQDDSLSASCVAEPEPTELGLLANPEERLHIPASNLGSSSRIFDLD